MPTASTSDGLSIAYETRGEGPLGVVFQHGWGSVGRHFDAVIHELQLAGRTFVTLDLAGHGASGNREDAHSVECYVRQLLAVADATGLKRFVTVGHSMGAKYNQYLRILAPERLLGQIAIAPSPAGEVREEASDEVIEQMSTLAGNVEALVGLLQSITSVEMGAEVKQRWAEAAAGIPGTVLAASMRAFSQTSFEAELAVAGDPPPTLVIAGKFDPIYPPDALIARVGRETPGAVIKLLECGHDVPIELPLETSLMVEGFLAATQAG